ncbi:cobalt-precorrin-6A reductase [Labilibacter sediminis]|nr:cobalt-precorrin-6A reductase [Labilibacter sediminis]
MIWVIGGTSEANHIAKMLSDEGYRDMLVSTTTAYGTELAQKNDVKVIQELLQPEQMKALIDENNISLVIDASHPFAQEVSMNAIKICQESRCCYIRYERKSSQFKDAKYYSSYAQLIEVLQKTQGRILLTIGSKHVHLFKDFSDERIVARVLPVVKSIQLCEKAGLKAHQIIATKGRVEKLTNMALMQEYDIKHLVTKDSGTTGGLPEKISAAQELGVSVHILERPQLDYPHVVFSYNELMNQVKSRTFN